MASVTTYTQAREKLATLLDEVTSTRETVVIRRRGAEDVALIGCGNVHYDALLRVPLSSIDQDSSGIGERAAKLALIRGEK